MYKTRTNVAAESHRDHRRILSIQSSNHCIHNNICSILAIIFNLYDPITLLKIHSPSSNHCMHNNIGSILQPLNSIWMFPSPFWKFIFHFLLNAFGTKLVPSCSHEIPSRWLRHLAIKFHSDDSVTMLKIHSSSSNECIWNKISSVLQPLNSIQLIPSPCWRSILHTLMNVFGIWNKISSVLQPLNSIHLIPSPCCIFSIKCLYNF